MQVEVVSQDTRKRIDKAVNYILKDLSADLSLEVLAAKANYSPFHFQKLFRHIMNESPKQYVMRMRAETAAHFLIIHKNKPIHVIASDCGFSSPAVFARSFKKYFKVSAEEFRTLKHPNKLMVEKSNRHLRKLIGKNHSIKQVASREHKIVVKSLAPQFGICMNTEFSSPDNIQIALRELSALARAHDLLLEHSRLMGIMYPHHNIYRAFIPVSRDAEIPSCFNKIEIRGGKFATFHVIGNIHDVFDKLSHFYHTWLPDNGYKLADVYGFEVFSEVPGKQNHHLIDREIFVPIEPLI